MGIESKFFQDPQRLAPIIQSINQSLSSPQNDFGGAKKRSERAAAEAYRFNIAENNKRQAWLNKAIVELRQAENARKNNKFRIDNAVIGSKKNNESIKAVADYWDGQSKLMLAEAEKLKAAIQGVSNARDARISQNKMKELKKVLEAMEESERKYYRAIEKKYIIAPGALRVDPIRLPSIPPLRIAPIKVKVGGLSEEDERDIARGSISFKELKL